MRQKIAGKCIVRCDFELFDEAGTILDSNEKSGQFSFVFGGGQVLPQLEKNFSGKEELDKFYVELEVEDAFGAYRENFKKFFAKEEIDNFDEIRIGDNFEMELVQGNLTSKVIAKDDKGIVLDANHPLAGKRLKFYFSIVEVRPLEENEVWPVPNRFK